ncbi:MAG TPA: class I SAM-dependent methyltransferase, partial [Vicinamibacteria bacterium]
AARMSAADEVLDAGCGCAEQDVLWARELGLRRIVGVDITPVRVDLAKRRVAEAGLQDRVEIRQGSATALPFPDASFDKVVALESAFHFPTRQHFLREAFRVLRPGGRLAVADVLPSPTRRRSWSRRLAVRLFRRCASIPEANVYDRIEYAARLATCGFVAIGMESIGDHVFPGFVRQKALHLAGQEWFSVVVDLQPADFVAEEWLSGWRDCLGLDEYVIVAAETPRTRGLADPGGRSDGAGAVH